MLFLSFWLFSPLALSAQIAIIGRGIFLKNTVMLKISKKGDKGYRISSVPTKKLKKLANDQHRFWSIDGDFLVLNSY
jgi:hypothetical protein